MASEPLLEEVDRLASGPGGLGAALDRILARFDCQVGTIHKLDPASGHLLLQVERGIPEKIMAEVREIPIGKGMAGLTAQRQEPVEVCNLQRDTSGKAKPGARETRMEGTVSVPILVDGQLRGTLGVAKPTIYEFTALEKNLLMQMGAVLGKHL